MDNLHVLKKILFVSLFAILCLPLITFFYISPAYTQFMIETTENRLLAIASHMAKTIEEDDVIDAEHTLPPGFVNQIEHIKEVVQLTKVKVFSPAGEIVYSSDAYDIGKQTTKHFFDDIVKQRKAYTVLADEIEKKEDGGKSTRKIVETYVPITTNHKVIGIFEIYYDITAEEQKLSTLKLNFIILLSFLTVGLVISIVFSIYETNAILEVRRKMEEERRIYDRQHMAMQKGQAIETLASGIAHDFNNILTAVQGYLDIASRLAVKDEKLRDIILSARTASQTAKDLTKKLVSISAKDKLTKKVSKVEKIVRAATKPFEKYSNMSMDLQFALDIYDVEVNEDAIKQVIQGIVVNAVEAMQQKGTVFIRCRNKKVDSQSKVPVKVGDYVRISIHDEGMGISEDIIDKIFDPYFSTQSKGSNRGIGLGLSYCQAIILNHDGCIVVKSRQGEGATFAIYLPAVQPAS